MSRKSSQDKNPDSENLLSYSISYFTSQKEQSSPRDIQSSSLSEQEESSSHDVFDSHSNKKKKKTKKIKNKQKNQSNSKNKTKNQSKTVSKISIPSKKQKDQKTNTTVNKNSPDQQSKKSQRTLNKFLGKKSQDEEIVEENEQKENQKIATYNLYPYEANYINRFELFKGYSLQKVGDSDLQQPYRSRIALKQRTLSRYLKYQKKKRNQSSQSDEPEEVKIYSKSYVVIKTILKAMLDNQKVHKFFKQPIDDITSCESELAYYEKYKELVESPLDLQTLEEMVDERNIKNLLEFNALFNQMIVNSVIFHTFMNNHKMVRSSLQLHFMFEKMMVQLSSLQMNETEKTPIKTTAFLQRPKSKKVSIEGQIKEMEIMDLNDLVNKNRIKVMNHFLKQLCQKHPQNIYTFSNRIKNLLHRYPNDKVEIIKLSNQKQTQLQKQNGSLKNSCSQHSYKNEEIYQVSAQSISVSLFQQLKELIKSELREIEKHEKKGEQSEQILRNILYPHDDSDDFDSMNDSDDT